MAMPESGPISLLDIQTEFGGTEPISLSEYYGVTSNTPTSGPIDIGTYFISPNAQFPVAYFSYFQSSQYYNPFYSHFYPTGVVPDFATGTGFETPDIPQGEWNVFLNADNANSYYTQEQVRLDVINSANNSTVYTLSTPTGTTRSGNFTVSSPGIYCRIFITSGAYDSSPNWQGGARWVRNYASLYRTTPSGRVPVGDIYAAFDVYVDFTR